MKKNAKTIFVGYGALLKMKRIKEYGKGSRKDF